MKSIYLTFSFTQLLAAAIAVRLALLMKSFILILPVNWELGFGNRPDFIAHDLVIFQASQFYELKFVPGRIARDMFIELCNSEVLQDVLSYPGLRGVRSRVRRKGWPGGFYEVSFQT